MAKISFSRIDEYAKVLDVLDKESDEILKSAVYKGAALVADEIKQEIKICCRGRENGLAPVGTPEHKLTGVTRRQKADLIDSFGLAPIENDDGYIQTKAGVDGYGSVKTETYPKCAECDVDAQHRKRDIVQGKEAYFQKSNKQGEKEGTTANGKGNRRPVKRMFRR